MTASLMEGYTIAKSSVWERGLVGIGAVPAYAIVITQHEPVVVGALTCPAVVIVILRAGLTIEAKAVPRK